jgi:hypothetical protein
VLPFVLLVGCTQGQVAVKYQASVSKEYTPFSFKDSSLEFVLNSSKTLLSPNVNNVYSPTTDYLCLLTALLGNKNDTTTLKELGFSSFKELEEVYPKYFEGINYESEKTSIRSISSLALVDLDKYNVPTLEKFANQYKISSLITSKNKLVSDVSKYYKDEIGLEMSLDDVLENVPAESLLALSGLTLKDSFSKEKGLITKPFTNIDGVSKDVQFVTSSEDYASYYKDESIEIFRLNIYATSLTFITGPDIDNIDITKVDYNKLQNKTVSYKVPKFQVEGKFDTTSLYRGFFTNKMFMPDVKPDLYFDSSFQKAKFELDEKGVKGEAFSGMIAVTSAGPVETIEVIIDKPFYFISTFQNAPLFIGKIVNL